MLPPGLYEVTFERKTGDTTNPDLVSGDWVMHCQQRTLDDIRAMGGNTPEDQRRFATAARVSEINLSLYRAFVQPFLKAMITPQVAGSLRSMNPQQLQNKIFAEVNPFVRPLAVAAERVRGQRSPAAADNPFLAAQEMISKQIVSTLDTWRDQQEKLSEQIFLAVYGSPVLQAAVGVDPASARPNRPAKSPLHRELVQNRIAELKSHIAQGGLQEAVIRSLLYVGLVRGTVDERGVNALRRIRLSGEASRLSLPQFKAMAREQFFLLLLDPEAALAAIPKLVPTDINERRKGLAAIRNVLSASGEIAGEAAERMARITRLFETDSADSLPFSPGSERAKAS